MNRARRRHERRVQTVWLVSAVTVLALTIPVLGYVGYHHIVLTREGRRVSAQNDPTKPNYEANVVPTPVLLLAQTDGQNLTGLTMLSLGGNDAGGAVLFLPVATTTDDVTAPAPSLDPESTTTSTTALGSVPQKISLRDGYASKGRDGLAQLTANALGLSFESVVVVDPTQLSQFVAPAGALTIDNPDRLLEVDARGRTAVAFPAGKVTLESADVPRYLALRNPKESDLARLARQEAVWRAWLAAVKASADPNIVPGETAAGLGRYVRALARGDVRYGTLPVTTTTDASGGEIFAVDPTTVTPVLSTFVPLPTPANPGDRIRVRLLSGVGPVDAVALIAAHLVPPNYQITIIGNADKFDYTETQVVFYDDTFALASLQLHGQLGVGQIVQRTTDADSEDITIIIGKDLVDKQGLKITQGSN